MVTSEDFEWWKANVDYDDAKDETVEVDVTVYGGEPESRTFTLDNDAYREDFPEVDPDEGGMTDEQKGEWLRRNVEAMGEWENEGGAIR